MHACIVTKPTGSGALHDLALGCCGGSHIERAAPSLACTPSPCNPSPAHPPYATPQAAKRAAQKRAKAAIAAADGAILAPGALTAPPHDPLLVFEPVAAQVGIRSGELHAMRMCRMRAQMDQTRPRCLPCFSCVCVSWLPLGQMLHPL